MTASTVTNLQDVDMRVMWNSEWYTLPARTSRIFTDDVAQHFYKNFPPQEVDQKMVECCSLTPVEGEMELRPMQRGFPDPDVPGLVHASYEALINAITMRVQARFNPPPASEEPGVEPDPGMIQAPLLPIGPERRAPQPPPGARPRGRPPSLRPG